MMVHDTKKKFAICSNDVQSVSSIVYRHQVIFSRRYRRKMQISLTFCVVGSHPAQIYLVKDCEVELTLYLHF